MWRAELKVERKVDNVMRAGSAGVEYFDAPGDPEELGADDEWGEAEEWDEASCAEKLQSDAFVSAMVYPEAMQFFPAKVTSALLDASDATLVAPIRVERIEESSGGEDGVTQLLTWQSDGPSESGRPSQYRHKTGSGPPPFEPPWSGQP